MTNLAKLLSLAALAVCVVPCLLCFAGPIGQEAVKWTALGGTVMWFIATPLWMGRELPVDAAEVEI